MTIINNICIDRYIFKVHMLYSDFFEKYYILILLVNYPNSMSA